MAIYSLDGNILNEVYDIEANSLQYAYDIDGNQIFGGESPLGISLKVMTYNVQKFNGINSQETMQNMIISTYDADVIGVQEIGNSASLPTVGTNMFTNYPNRQFSNHKNYLLSASKSLSFSNVVVADYTNQDPLDASQYNETRSYVKVEIAVGDKTVTWFNTHLCYLTTSYKYAQMTELFELAEQCDYVILTGDFNSGSMTAESDDYIYMYKQFVDAGYNLANCSPESGFTNTYTSATSASSLSDLISAPDTIIVSGNIDIDSVVFDTTKFSYLNGSAIDHIPVIANLTIN